MTRSQTTPWTLRAYEALPGNPVQIGLALGFSLLLLFFLGRALFDGAANSTSGDLRIAITQILMTAYSASAYAYVLMSARATTVELATGQRSLHWQTAAEQAGKHNAWILFIAGAASYLVVGVAVTNATTPDVNPWDWHGWNYDVLWHRATTVLFVWWIGCFCYVTVAESARLSRLTRNIENLDLLDLETYQPLTRQGLTNALLVIGTVSVLSLLAVESRYWTVLIGFWISFIFLAWVGLMLPLWGIRRSIRVARDREIEWVDRQVRDSRDALKRDSNDGRSIAELLAYRTVIETVGNWPFDRLTLMRFAVLLLIPLGSWLGAALVERGLDLVLS